MNELVNKAAEYAELWELLFPEEYAVPSQRQFLLWLSSFSEADVKRAIQRTATKVEMGGLAVADVLRYASGTMRNLRNGVEYKHQQHQLGGAQ